MKKIFALILAMLLVLGMTSALADGEIVLTIHNTTEKAHTYSAYQIFSGTIEGTGADKKLTGIDWGANVTNTAGLLNALKTSTAFKTGDDFDFAGANSAADVARILGTLSNNADKVKAFANLVEGSYLTSSAAASAPLSGTGSDRSAALDVTATGAGYYLVKDTGDSIPQGETATKFVLQLVESKTVEAKDTHLTPEKKIVEGQSRVDDNNAAIGDDVFYEIKLPIPDTTEYSTFKLVMNDTMSKGLTFKEITSIKIVDDEQIVAADTASLTTAGKIQAADLASGEKELTNVFAKIENAANDAHKLTVTFKNFKAKAENPAGTAKSGYITICYTATLNKDAIIEGDGNPNTVNFDYSNNPNKDYTGDKFGNDEPHGTTPDDTVRTFVTELLVKKVDGTHNDAALPGAEFNLTGTELNTQLLTGTKFVPIDQDLVTGEETRVGTTVYYKLTDGTYTDTAPTTPNIDTSKYVKVGNDYPQYKKITYTKKEITSSATDKTVWSDENGLIKFTGLKANESGNHYTLTEVTAPAGYNKLTSGIGFTVTWTAPTTAKPNGEFTITATSSDYTITKNTDGVWEIKVQNNTGSTLPTTGGIGTTLFYIGGGILVLLAVVMLVTKRRMSSND